MNQDPEEQKVAEQMAQHLEDTKEAPPEPPPAPRYEVTEREGQNNMGYWLPLLQQMQMRVPETILVGTGGVNLLQLLNGSKPAGFDQFMERLKLACHQIGYPVFLRTGHTSDKHDWERTCYVKNKNHLVEHVARLVEASVMANIAGYPFDYNVFAVRRIIPTKPLFHYFNGNMPIAKEMRYFIKDGDILTSMPYWPEEVFENADEKIKEKVAELRTISSDDKIDLDLMARYIAKHMPGFWSVDFLQDSQGRWWAIDMAVGERSYGCPPELAKEYGGIVADAFREVAESHESEAIVGDEEIISKDQNHNDDSSTS